MAFNSKIDEFRSKNAEVEQSAEHRLPKLELGLTGAPRRFLNADLLNPCASLVSAFCEELSRVEGTVAKAHKGTCCRRAREQSSNEISFIARCASVPAHRNRVNGQFRVLQTCTSSARE